MTRNRVGPLAARLEERISAKRRSLLNRSRSARQAERYGYRALHNRGPSGGLDEVAVALLRSLGGRAE